MHINDIKFKVNTIDNGPKVNTVDTESSDGISSEEMDQMLEESADENMEDYFADSFGDPLAASNPANQKGCTGNVNPLDDYMMGDMSEGQLAADPNAEGLDFLENAPPSLDDIIAGNEKATAYLDIVKERYEKFYQDISSLKSSYEQAVAAGGINANQIAILNQRIELATKALVKCEQELNKLEQLSTQLDNLYKQEMSLGKDLNNDGWLGKPYRDYLIKKNEDGTIALLDAATKKAIPCPFLDPEYKPQLTKDNSLEMITIEEAYESGNFGGEIAKDDKGDYTFTEGAVDLLLRINKDALGNSNENYLDVFADIGIPQVLWVEKGDVDSAEPYKFEYDEALGMERFSMYDSWSSDGGIHQEIPADLSKFVQLEVTGAKLYSEPSGLKDANDTNSGDLYNHFLELYNGTTLICRVRIEGTQVDDGNPLATETDKGINYIGASSLSFGFNGEMRSRPLEFDGGGFKSTGRHYTERQKLLDTLGIEEPTEEAMRAFNETFQAFTEKSQTTQYFDGQDWKDQLNDFGENYGENYNDAYLPPDKQPGDNDTLLEFRTGIFVHDMRGDIKGTGFNDIIQTLGVNEKTDYAKKVTPEDVEPVLTGDAFYSNIVRAGAGNDIVAAGFGDNYITGATFVSVKSNPNDSNYIMLQDLTSHGIGTNNTKDKNPKCYVKVDGGSDTHIINPEEDSYGLHKDDNPDDGDDNADRWDKSFVEDFFDISSGSVSYTIDPFEGEYTGSASIEKDTPMNAEAVQQAISDAKEEFYNELTKVPDVDESALEASWDDVMTEKTMLDDEMDGFFNEMFGEMDSLLGELEMGPEE